MNNLNLSFGSADEMLEYIQHGNDLYNTDTGKYVFLYTDTGSICVYDLTPSEAKALAEKVKDTGEYWGGYLGPGGFIYDATQLAIYDALSWCSDNFNNGNDWINTTDALDYFAE